MTTAGRIQIARIAILLAVTFLFCTSLSSVYAAQIMGINDGVLWLDASTLNLSNGSTVNTWTNSATGGGIAGNAVLDKSDQAYIANAFN